MLTIRESLQLNSLAPISTVSESLAEKIIGNYQLMNLTMTAQDLLHMTMMQPDIYITMEQNNAVCIENQIRNQNQSRLAVMNQFLNRSLLYATPDFTYQDEVFVASVLQKLGIYQVAEFMKQIRLDMQHSQLTGELLTQYVQNAQILKSAAEKFLSGEESRKAGQVQENTQTARLYLQNEIYERLGTAEHIRVIYQYGNAYTTRQSLSEERFSLLQQLQLADRLLLSRIQQLVLQLKQPFYRQQYLYYEQKPVEGKLTQEKVMQQLTAAILQNLIQKLYYKSMQSKEEKTYVWEDYSQVFYGSLADVIQKFQKYHTGSQMIRQDLHDSLTYINRLYQEEINLINVVQQIEAAYPYAGSDFIRQTQDLNEPTALESWQKQEQCLQQLYQNIREEGLEVLNIHSSQYHDACHHILRNTFSEAFVNRIVNAQIQQSKMCKSKLWENEIQQDEIWTRKARENEIQQDKIWTSKIQQDSLSEDESLRILLNTEEAEEKREEYYRQYLNQMNEHNRKMQQLLQQSEQPEQQEKKVLVDRKQAKKNSLKALEAPQELLKEIYETSYAIEQNKNIEAERFLQLADASTRAVYEELFRITGQKEGGKNKTKETAAKEKAIHIQETNIADFYQVLQENNQRETEIRENTHSRLECLQLVHHSPIQRQEELAEEIKDTLGRQLQWNKEEYHSANIRHTEQIVQQQLQETRKELRKENEELITAMVHQNMQSQLGSITDRVYHDMERRLANERRRRGY